MRNARILVANTPMDTDKIKVFGSRVRVDAVSKVADLEAAEKLKMKEKVDKILKHDINVFINRLGVLCTFPCSSSSSYSSFHLLLLLLLPSTTPTPPPFISYSYSYHLLLLLLLLLTSTTPPLPPDIS